MSLFLKAYFIYWITATIIAVFVISKNRKRIPLFSKDYWKFITKKWKLLSFITALISIIAVAPFSTDPTWDYFDSVFIPVLVYINAPWTIGIIYKFFKKKADIELLYSAFCVSMFSICWSYDLYIFFRDGQYPASWMVNIIGSSVPYIIAGLYWNLDYRKERGIIYAYTENDWPNPKAQAHFKKVFIYAGAYIFVIVYMVSLFVYNYLYING